MPILRNRDSGDSGRGHVRRSFEEPAYTGACDRARRTRRAIQRRADNCFVEVDLRR